MQGSNLTPEKKARIDKMSHIEMAKIWRFSDTNNGENLDLLCCEAGEYFQNRLFNVFGGFTPEISKQIGWERNGKCNT